MEQLTAWGVVTVVGSFVGSFIGSYLKKKGENLATHEDISKLVEQVRAVTQATKEIEAKILSAVWDRQKRWELKRDVLFEATRRLGAVEDALMSLNTAYQVTRAREKAGEPVFLEAKAQAGARWMGESSKFEETILLIGMVCGKDLKETCTSFRLRFRRIASEILQGDPEIYFNSLLELMKKSNAITTAMRKELETDKAG